MATFVTKLMKYNAKNRIAEVANIDPNPADEQGASTENKTWWIPSDPFKELVHKLIKTVSFAYLYLLCVQVGLWLGAVV